jgi:acyl-CoA thioester hydrolase
VEGFRFSTDVRVRFAETDAQRIAHNATYLVWFEVARVAYLDEFTAGYRAFQDAGYEATVVEARLRYVAPAVFDDVIRIWTRCVDVRGARFRYEYVLERAGDGACVADGWTSHACVDAKTMRPTRLPAWLVEAVATAESSSAPSSSATS